MATAKTHQFLHKWIFCVSFYILCHISTLPINSTLNLNFNTVILRSILKYILIIMDIICSGIRQTTCFCHKENTRGWCPEVEVKSQAVRLLRTCWCEGGGCGNYNAIRTTIGPDHNTSYRLIADRGTLTLIVYIGRQ